MSDDIPSDPPPVEPMSDVSWARIERGLLSRLDSQTTAPIESAPKRRWLYVAIPAIAAAAAITLVLALQGGGEPPKTSPVTDGSSVAIDVEPSRVVSGDSASTVSFGDAHLSLAAKTAIVMTREGGSPSVLLERGTVDFTVAPRENRPPFVVRAGDTVVRVVGTQFQVARYDEHVDVKVTHGIVDVQFRGNTVRLARDQAWSSENPEAVTQIAQAEVAPPVVDQPAVEKPRPAKPAAAKIDKPVPPSTTAGVDLDQQKFERIQSLEVRDPQAAIKGYLELANGNSRWAANALYAAGRLAADRGDPRAKTFLTIYLRRFPKDINARSATTLLNRLEGD